MTLCTTDLIFTLAKLILMHRFIMLGKLQFLMHCCSSSYGNSDCLLCFIARRDGWTGYRHYLENYRTNTSRVWLTRLSCQGNERNIAQCSHIGWGASTSIGCDSHRYDSVVQCLQGISCVFICNEEFSEVRYHPVSKIGSTC